MRTIAISIETNIRPYLAEFSVPGPDDYLFFVYNCYDLRMFSPCDTSLGLSRDQKIGLAMEIINSVPHYKGVIEQSSEASILALIDTFKSYIIRYNKIDH